MVGSWEAYWLVPYFDEASLPAYHGKSACGYGGATARHLCGRVEERGHDLKTEVRCFFNSVYGGAQEFFATTVNSGLALVRRFLEGAQMNNLFKHMKDVLYLTFGMCDSYPKGPSVKPEGIDYQIKSYDLSAKTLNTLICCSLDP